MSLWHQTHPLCASYYDARQMFIGFVQRSEYYEVFHVLLFLLFAMLKFQSRKSAVFQNNFKLSLNNSSSKLPHICVTTTPGLPNCHPFCSTIGSYMGIACKYPYLLALSNLPTNAITSILHYQDTVYFVIIHIYF